MARIKTIVTALLAGVLLGPAPSAEGSSQNQGDPPPAVPVGRGPNPNPTYGTKAEDKSDPEENVGTIGGQPAGGIVSTPAAVDTPAEPEAPASEQNKSAEAQKALDEAAEQFKRRMIEEIQRRSAMAGGDFNGSTSAARDVRGAGGDAAATLGALYCAQGAVNQAGRDAERASQNFGSCKQYFDAANGLKAGSALKEDSSTLNLGVARGVLSRFERTFGVNGSDFVDRMLGARGSLDELSDLTKTRLKAEQLAKAFESAEAPVGSNSLAALFEVNLAGSGAKKGSQAASNLRDSLRKSLSAEGGRNPASVGAASKDMGERREPEGERIRGLEPLREGIFATPESNTVEISIFGVVHLKYLEVSKKRDL